MNEEYDDYHEEVERQKYIEAQKEKYCLERKNSSYYREGLYGYVSMRKSEEKAPKVFLFPLSKDGFQSVSSKNELAQRLKTKFREAYPNPEMQCNYTFQQRRAPGPMKDEEIHLKAFCQTCTNYLLYVKNMFTENEYRLVKMIDYHVHGKDPYKVEEILRKTQNFTRFTLRQGRPYEIKAIEFDEKTQSSVENFIKKLPLEITNETRCNIVCNKFKITRNEYEKAMRQIKSQYDIPFKELLAKFDSKSYTYRYLPQNLTEINQDYIQNRKQAEFQHNLRNHDHDRIKNVHEIDILNPDLPNVLLVISPQMKQLFYKYGQYVGFDLTFSLIREKPEQAKEYLVGVFAGTSQTRKIMIFGLVITNNQSEEVYKYIFRQFITIMGKGPETFITDEQQSIFFALRSLKKEGIWLGQHLLDMFHILKKFRKRCESGTFQLLRKMMHSRDRYEYRRAFKEAMLQVSSDDEADLLRSFDMQSQRYCFSQILGSFVGIGISDAINQKFHDLIKAQIPYESKYIKTTSVILDLIQSRNSMNKYGIIDKNPIEQRLGLPFMKLYRTILSDRIFQFLLKEIYKSLPLQILSKGQQNYYNKLSVKLQPQQPLLRSKDIFKVKSNSGVFGVWLDQREPINENSSKQGKLRCYCQFQQKSGYLCSHIVRVLMHLRLQFLNNIHPRWLIRYDQIDEGLKKFLYRQRKHQNMVRVRLRKNPKKFDDDFECQQWKVQKSYKKEMNIEQESDDQEQITRQDVYSEISNQDLYDMDHQMIFD